MKRNVGSGPGRKSAKRADDATTVQTALRLPVSMLEELRDKAGERGVAGEIRTRVQASLEAEKADAKTHYLLATAADLVNEVDALYGKDSWHRDSFAFQVLTEAVKDLLAHFQPDGPVATKPNPETVEMGEFFENDPPDKIGKFTTRRWLKLHPPHVDVKLHQPSKDSGT
jgi:hypothetical protein